MPLLNFFNRRGYLGALVQVNDEQGNSSPAVARAVTIVDQSGNAAGAGTSAAPTVSRSQGSGSFATNQVSIATTATQIAASRTTRNSITIVNGGTTDVFIGGAGVTTTNGILLPGTKGASITLPVTGAVFGIVGTGTQSVSYAESY